MSTPINVAEIFAAAIQSGQRIVQVEWEDEAMFYGVYNVNDNGEMHEGFPLHSLGLSKAIDETVEELSVAYPNLTADDFKIEYGVAVAAL